MIPNSPENYARTLWPLMKEILVRDSNSFFAFDKHFSKRSQHEEVLRILEHWANHSLHLEQLDSQQNPRIQIADFVAGAALAKYQREDDSFLGLVADKIVIEYWLTWDEIKKW